MTCNHIRFTLIALVRRASLSFRGRWRLAPESTTYGPTVSGPTMIMTTPYAIFKVTHHRMTINRFPAQIFWKKPSWDCQRLNVFQYYESDIFALSSYRVIGLVVSLLQDGGVCVLSSKCGHEYRLGLEIDRFVVAFPVAFSESLRLHVYSNSNATPIHPSGSKLQFGDLFSSIISSYLCF